MKEIQATKTVVDNSLRETKTHGTQGFPIGIYLDDFADFENGYICWHWHEEVQLTMILEGEFICQTENEEINLKAGDVMFINSGILHQIRPVKLSQGKLYSFIWKGELLGGTRVSDIYKECVKPMLTNTVASLFWKGDSREGKKIAVRLQEIVVCYQEKQKYFYLKIHHLLSEIWLELLKYMPEKQIELDSAAERDQQRVKSAIAYIHENYQEPLRLSDIAEAVYISKSELCRSFKRVLHLSPMEFLIQYRIRQSTALLKNKQLRILDVAEITGFCSPSHFGNNFHKYMGCTPKEYRQSL